MSELAAIDAAGCMDQTCFSSKSSYFSERPLYLPATYLNTLRAKLGKGVFIIIDPIFRAEALSRGYFVKVSIRAIINTESLSAVVKVPCWGIVL